MNKAKIQYFGMQGDIDNILYQRFSGDLIRFTYNRLINTSPMINYYWPLFNKLKI